MVSANFLEVLLVSRPLQMIACLVRGQDCCWLFYAKKRRLHVTVGSVVIGQWAGALLTYSKSLWETFKSFYAKLKSFYTSFKSDCDYQNVLGLLMQERSKMFCKRAFVLRSPSNHFSLVPNHFEGINSFYNDPQITLRVLQITLRCIQIIVKQANNFAEANFCTDFPPYKGRWWQV